MPTLCLSYGFFKFYHIASRWSQSPRHSHLSLANACTGQTTATFNVTSDYNSKPQGDDKARGEPFFSKKAADNFSLVNYNRKKTKPKFEIINGDFQF
jgi:hypothetical protein